MQPHPTALPARRSPLALALVSGVAMVLLGAAALALKAPMLFPAIGASAWVVFRHPEAPPAAPRNVLLGHGLGAVIGWIALWGCVGFEARGSLADLAQWQYVASGATALGATVFVLELLRVVHPPAAATTMIVGMGLLPKLAHLAAIVGAALGLVLIARVLRVRASGPA